MSNDKRKFDNFDQFAQDYTEILNKSIKISGEDQNFFNEYKVKEIASREDAQKVTSVLDFGCGTGLTTAYLHQYFPNAKITGLDVSQHSIQVANNNYQFNNVQFLAFDGTSLPFDANSFDIIFVSMVFHHINHELHTGILNQMHKVLKPGGRYYNFEHNPYNPLTRNVVDKCPFDTDAVLLKPAYAKAVVQGSQFKNVQTKFTIFVPRLPILKYFTFIESFIGWLPIGAQYYVSATK